MADTDPLVTSWFGIEFMGQVKGAFRECTGLGSENEVTNVSIGSAIHGRFSRAFVLPEPIDIESVTADLTEGLLTLTLPKAGGRGVRRIDVT